MNDEGLAPPGVSHPRPGPITLRIGPFTLAQAVIIIASVGGMLVMAVQTMFPQFSLDTIFIFGLSILSFFTVTVTFPPRLAHAVAFLFVAVTSGVSAMAIHASHPGSLSDTVASILLLAFSVFVFIPGLGSMVQWARHQESFGGAA